MKSVSSKSNNQTNLEVKYVFTEEIDILYSFLSNSQTVTSLLTNSNFQNILGRKEPQEYSISLKEEQSTEHTKKIVWFLEDKINKEISIKFSVNLICDTLSESTIFVLLIKILNSHLIPKKSSHQITNELKKDSAALIDGIDLLINTNENNKIEFESILINAPIQIVWDFIFHNDDNHHEGFYVNLRQNEEIVEGSTLYFVNNDFKVECVVEKIKKGDSYNKWKLRIRPKDIQNNGQKIEYEFYKIDENTTFLSNSHIFQGIVSKDMLRNIKAFKLYLLETIKERIENHNCEKEIDDDINLDDRTNEVNFFNDEVNDTGNYVV